ncbi:RidA family protein [Haloarcula onubensis]|uniref:RidA family protein n=1 Tax=Haloarcula onubensis TaxID=2950539 RepID=A0ABU2FR44_9EURY|nr:RidA family protein [Halomicroarcula sp. S3CR25-11]MDS0282752.1 RidA family protein [Halomicroarcula sp. S3CR25-11]
MREILTTEAGAGQVGNFNLGTSDGDLVFTAGQVPETEDGEVLTDAPIEEQTHQCLRNIEAVLESEGLSMEHVLKVNVYIVDIQHWERFDEAYGEHFEELPARTTVGVTGLWGGVDVEIEAVATAEL